MQEVERGCGLQQAVTSVSDNPRGAEQRKLTLRVHVPIPRDSKTP